MFMKQSKIKSETHVSDIKSVKIYVGTTKAYMNNKIIIQNKIKTF